MPPEKWMGNRKEGDGGVERRGGWGKQSWYVNYNVIF